MTLSARPTLVVGPDEDAARQLAEQLSRAGFAADVVSSYWSARNLARIRTYGSLVCFVDLNLAGDRAALTALREPLPRTWIIAISADMSPDIELLARRSGADAVLSQPVSMKDLTSRLAAFSLRGRPPGAGG